MSDRLDPDELAALEEERDFLLRSLDDLEAEHDAGDVDEDDYRVLRDDYTARAAEAIRAVDEGRARFDEAARPGNPWRTGVIVGAVVAVAVLAGVLVAQSSGRRDVGDQLTGDIRQSERQAASAGVGECLSSEDPAEPVATLECYDAVLEDDPSNVGALTYRGWFLVRLGMSGGEATQLVDLGLESLDEAVAIDPGFADARVFRAVAYREVGDLEAALAELDAFDELGAPEQAQQLADQLRVELETAVEASTSTTAAAG